MTGIFYAISVEELPASIAVVLLFQFTWIGVVIEAIANRTFPSREKVISIIILFTGTLFAGGVFEGLGQNFSTKGNDLWSISRCLFFILCFCKWACCYRSSALYEKLSWQQALLLSYVYSSRQPF